jgi:hypothetical protein
MMLQLRDPTKSKNFKAHRLTVIDPLKPLAREFAPVTLAVGSVS